MSDWVTLRDAMGLTLRPVAAWPGRPTPAWAREKGPFTAPLKDTINTLRRELTALRAKNVVLQIALREQDFRLDGPPRAGAVAVHPGVVLAFDSRHGPLRLWSDRFTRWANNLRALAMHLEHLRMAGLYGVGTDGQQYQGWKALPAPEGDHGGDARATAALLIARAAGVGQGAVAEMVSDSQTLDYYYRVAVKLLHPDRGGSSEQFIAVRTAYDLLRDRVP